MKSIMKIRYIVIMLLGFIACAYAQKNSLTMECEKGWTTSCFALIQEAQKQRDSKSVALYQAKALDMLDSACKRDYQTCLLLAQVYESADQNAVTQAIKRDIAAQKIPTHTLLVQQDLVRKNFEDAETILPLLRSTPDSSKATLYQERAINGLESACYDSDVAACFLLHYFYEYGVAIAQNRPKAERLVRLGLEYATRACVLGDMELCKIIKAYPDYRAWIAKEVGNLARKCDEKDWAACFQVSLYYTQDYYVDRESSMKAHEDKSDFFKAANYLQKACALDTKSCDESIFRISGTRACVMDKDMQACARLERPEFLSLSCESGNMESCYALRTLPTIANDLKRYVKLLQRVCRGGVIESCVQLAGMYEQGERVGKNREKAWNFMQRACSWSMRKQVAGSYCYQAGLGYESGEFAKQDIPKAMETYQYACESANVAAACERLGTLYVGHKQNMQSALFWYKKACQISKDSVIGCIQVAKNAANGEYLALNIEEALAIYESLLQDQSNLHNEIYFNLAKLYGSKEIYNVGTRTTQPNAKSDYAKALRYYKKACKLDMQEACEVKLVLPNLTQACQANDALSCYQIASLFELLQEDPSIAKMLVKADIQSMIPNLNSKKPIPQDKKAISQLLYTQACRGNVGAACVRLYDMTRGLIERDEAFQNDLVLQEMMCHNLQPRQEAKGVCLSFARNAIHEQSYQRALHALTPYQSKEDGEALDLLAQVYFSLKDYKGVLETYRHIYQYELPNDYYYLAQMYSYGLGVRQDYKRARDIYKLTQSPRNYLGQAQMYNDGLGVPQSFVSAKEYYELACPLQGKESKVASEACVRLGASASSAGDFQTAQQYYLRACAVGYSGDEITCQKDSN